MHAKMSKVLLGAAARGPCSGLPQQMPINTIVSATMNLAKDLHGAPPKRVPVVHGAHNDLGIALLTDETHIDAPQGATPYSANFSALLNHSRRNNRVPLSTEDVARVTGSKGRQMHALCACTHVRTQ
jgi:hypothetical protein